MDTDKAAMSAELDQFISKWKELEAMLMTVDFGDKKDEVMRRWNELGSAVIAWKSKMGGSDMGMGGTPTGGSTPPSMPPAGDSTPPSTPPTGGMPGGGTPPTGGMPPSTTGM